MSPEDYWIKARSAEGRAGRGREKDKSDELDNFERRLEWFRLYHSDRSGWTSDLQVRQAVEHTLRLENLLPQMILDPGGGAPARGYAAVTEKGRAGVRVRRAKNPAPRSGLGFVGEPVAVAFDERKLPTGVDVKVTLAAKAAKHVDLSSIRMFRFDEETKAWVLVPRSGPAQDFTYTWVRAHRPGLYVAAGLPSEPALLLAVVLLHSLRPQLEVSNRLQSTG